MRKSFKVTLNKQVIYTYTEKASPARVRRFLQEVEIKLNQGIQLGENWVEHPTEFERVQFVAMLLFNALDKNDMNQAELISTYISLYSEEINEVCVTLENDLINLVLI